MDATTQKWKQYRMYSYITKELMGLLRSDAKGLDLDRMSIFGHSMGGHGALTIGLKNPETFKSISAFSPICHPCDCPWGKKGVHWARGFSAPCCARGARLCLARTAVPVGIALCVRTCAAGLCAWG